MNAILCQLSAWERIRYGFLWVKDVCLAGLWGNAGACFYPQAQEARPPLLHLTSSRRPIGYHAVIIDVLGQSYAIRIWELGEKMNGKRSQFTEASFMTMSETGQQSEHVGAVPCGFI